MLLKFDSDLGQFAKLMNSWEISSRLGSYGEVNLVIPMAVHRLGAYEARGEDPEGNVGLLKRLPLNGN